jgi:hypothetical protein
MYVGVWVRREGGSEGCVWGGEEEVKRLVRLLTQQVHLHAAAREFRVTGEVQLEKLAEAGGIVVAERAGLWGAKRREAGKG